MNPGPAPILRRRPAPRGSSRSDWPPARRDGQRRPLRALIGPRPEDRQFHGRMSGGVSERSSQ